MNHPLRAWRAGALIAAYVIALQALLLPLSVAAGGLLQASLCSEVASGNGSSAPTRHDTGCPCAAGCSVQCCTQGCVGSRQTGIAFWSERAVVLNSAPAPESVIRRADRSPQIPRAPPLA